MTKTETILRKICELLEIDFQDVPTLFTYEVFDTTETNGESFLLVNFQQTLNVTLSVGLNVNSSNDVQYTPADGSKDADYNIFADFNLPTAIKVWDLMSRQLIDCRRIVEDLMF